MSRRLHAVLAVLFGGSVFLSLGASGSCTGTVARKPEGEPCTRTSECASDLACSGGTCRASDGGSSDAGIDGSAEAGGP